MANDLLVRGLSEGNVLASDSDNTQNFQNVYQNPVLISPNIETKFGNAKSLAFSVDGHKQVFCKICNREFSCLSSLNPRIKSVHKGMRYTCDQCDYKFTDTGNLDKHVKTIHERIHYPCSQCDYKATQKPYLKSHVSSKHN